MAKLTLNYPNIQDERGQLHSIADESLYLTFGVWLYLIPQYKPKNVLMLGYGGGTAAKLITKFYGDVPITAVDFSDVSEFLLPNVTWIQADAKKWIHETDQKFDCIIVDLYDTGDYLCPKFVLTKKFANRLGEMCDYLILHTMRDDDVSNYKFKKIRQLSTNSGGQYEPHFHYYMINEVPSLPVR